MTIEEFDEFASLAREIHPRIRSTLRIVREAIQSSANEIEGRRSTLRTLERLRDAERVLAEAIWALDDHERAVEADGGKS